MHVGERDWTPADGRRHRAARHDADLAIGGAEVISALARAEIVPPDFRGGARVGRILRWLFEQVTDQPERNERSRLLALLDKYFDDELA